MTNEYTGDYYAPIATQKAMARESARWIAPYRWYLTLATDRNHNVVPGALILVKTKNYLSSPSAAPVNNPAAILKALRETHYPVAVRIEL